MEGKRGRMLRFDRNPSSKTNLHEPSRFEGIHFFSQLPPQLLATVFLSTLKSDESPGTFNCTRKRCKTCPFIHNTDKVTGPKRSIKITDRFTCTSANVIYCRKCTLCKKIYIGETGRRIGDRFREHLRDVECNDKDASKPVTRHLNLPNHSTQNMAICGLSMHQGNTESRKKPRREVYLPTRFS